MEFVDRLKSIPSLTFAQLYSHQGRKTDNIPLNFGVRANPRHLQNDPIHVVSPFGKKCPLKHSHPHSEEDSECAACLFVKLQAQEIKKK